MTADPNSSFAPHSSEQLPNSRRVYLPGRLHPDLRVPMREITLAPTKSYTGHVEVNEPVHVYDCSGPWGDPEFTGTVEAGLPPLRRDWIVKRRDVEECDGRVVKPADNGYLSDTHAAARGNGNSKFEIRNSKFLRRPWRASAGHPVTQLWYARQGIITPEMEFIAIRENMRSLELGTRNSEPGTPVRTTSTSSTRAAHSVH